MTGMTRRTGGGSPPWLQAHKIVDLIDEIKEKKGVARLVIGERLRKLSNTMLIEDFLEQLRRIEDDKSLDILLGVGMRGIRYHATVKRKAEMMGL